jgi:hypothetical protein
MIRLASHLGSSAPPCWAWQHLLVLLLDGRRRRLLPHLANLHPRPDLLYRSDDQPLGMPTLLHDPIVSASLLARLSFHLDRSLERRSRLIAHSYKWKAKGRGATHGSGPLSRLSSMQAVRLHLTPA